MNQRHASPKRPLQEVGRNSREHQRRQNKNPNHMRTNPILLIIVLCCWAFPSHAQQVLNSTGASISGNNLLIEYSVGEVATAAIGTPSAGNYYTAGVIQPNYWIVNGVDVAFDELYSLKVFPNPVANQLTIETDFRGFKMFRFTDLLGQKAAHGNFNYLPLELSWMPQGTYFLTLTSENEQITKTIKVIKQ